jgi:hypothetical protein
VFVLSPQFDQPPIDQVGDNQTHFMVIVRKLRNHLDHIAQRQLPLSSTHHITPRLRIVSRPKHLITDQLSQN